MTEFVVGDRVRLVNIKDTKGDDYDPDDSNIIGNIGVVSEVEDTDSYSGPNPYLVQWDNGEINDYHVGNLEKLFLNMRSKP